MTYEQFIYVRFSSVHNILSRAHNILNRNSRLNNVQYTRIILSIKYDKKRVTGWCLWCGVMVLVVFFQAVVDKAARIRSWDGIFSKRGAHFFIYLCLGLWGDGILN